MNNISVGIIGGTRGMGSWLAGLMQKENTTVHICGRKTPLGIKDIAKLCHVIVVAVPIAATNEVIKQVGPLLDEDKLLMDLTSLKKEPVEMMLAHTRAEVIGCHPLFGPQMQDFSGQNIILCPARGTKWLTWIKELFQNNTYNVFETDPAHHDKMMAIVQVLNHLHTISLGMTIAATQTPPEELDRFSTPALRAKIEIVKKVFTESPELYADIITRNPDTAKIIALYEKTLADIRALAQSGDATKLKDALEKTAKKLF
ncbi:MAG TPA: prephenate dehydrogenase/arogenate dehydrogenase family protein [Deltaproteobacteria bacterium]|nr:prephenate dehydrogenase/arogenate dehydrogenase family protein [Deltaproteobacteria bacterium]